jgi:hypothetical protein
VPERGREGRERGARAGWAVGRAAAQRREGALGKRKEGEWAARAREKGGEEREEGGQPGWAGPKGEKRGGKREKNNKNQKGLLNLEMEFEFKSNFK